MFKSFKFTPPFSCVITGSVHQLRSRVRNSASHWSFNGRTFKASLKSSRLLDDRCIWKWSHDAAGATKTPSVEFRLKRIGRKLTWLVDLENIWCFFRWTSWRFKCCRSCSCHQHTRAALDPKILRHVGGWFMGHDLKKHHDSQNVVDSEFYCHY